MGWAVAIFIVALLGNFYLLSGNDVDSGSTAIIVGFAVLADILIVGYLIYVIFNNAKGKVNKVNKANLQNKRQFVINELKEQISNKQDILNHFEKYYCKKRRIFNLANLISSCDTNESQNLIDVINRYEMSSYEQLKREIAPNLSKEEKQHLPATPNDFTQYKAKLDKKIQQLNKRISFAENANKSGLNELIEATCPTLNEKLRKKKIKLFISCAFIVTVVMSILIVCDYANNTPYLELRTKIEEQTLTADMVEKRDSENSYYKTLTSEKGYKFLADVFSELHSNDDIEKAMWLLCVQPDCINGIDLCASDSFIDWVVDYAKENGTKTEQSDGQITYAVNGYEIKVNSIFELSSIGHTFYITNGSKGTSVENRNPFYEGTVPTIK